MLASDAAVPTFRYAAVDESISMSTELLYSAMLASAQALRLT
jgi:hypothetical protein